MHGSDRTAYVERKKKKRVKKILSPIRPAKKTRRTRPARVITEKGLKTEYCNKTIWIVNTAHEKNQNINTHKKPGRRFG